MEDRAYSYECVQATFAPIAATVYVPQHQRAKSASSVASTSPEPGKTAHCEEENRKQEPAQASASHRLREIGQDLVDICQLLRSVADEIDAERKSAVNDSLQRAWTVLNDDDKARINRMDNRT